MSSNDSKSERLLKFAELIWNAHLHNEDLSHAIFYVLTATMIGILTLSINYVKFERTLLLILSSTLAIGGLYLTYKFQGSNDQSHLILNKIRYYFNLDNLTINVNNEEKSIFPESWKKYEYDLLKDCYIKERQGIKAGGLFSWWMVYKWIHFIMFIINILIIINIYYPLKIY